MKRLQMTLMCALALTGCEGNTVKEMVGLGRSAPDEFRVVTRPPLSVPPEFTLRPPGDTSGAAPSVMPVDEKAQGLVISDGKTDTFALPGADDASTAKTTAPKVNSADSQFLQNAGAGIADSNVRSMLEEEKIYYQIEKEEKGWWDSLTVWDEQEPIVDAEKEAERIKTNKETGKPITEGEVAEKKEKDTGVIGRIFGDW